ncbi:hypothetical protein I5R65_06065 [Herbaspirillum sp. AP02]|uniref:hypothetical protein n=1 Tax=unclassified Herbaspirillum TaxID=2624150 RepID=UPI0015DA225E|nr:MULTISPECIES: hypothetical protein [unclassified Herbaspirillum]MBG7619022.1 hypothetical protein [Herbaspirillum sp. AP02]NZD66306.1 hypothetical protein [Herbaspirillum sp. AP21]
MAKSQKTIVIKHLFEQFYDANTHSLRRTIVTAQDLEDAKRFCNENYGTTIKLDGNPFNFMKDIVRGKSASKIWPEDVRARGFVGEQRTGDGKIFEFVPLVEGASESFDIDFRPTELTPELAVQSLSLPQASKQLGRNDESWLLQVAVNLRVVETHFAVGENPQINALELNHLQMDIKLRKVQIDALYIAKCASDNVLITVEAKQGNQRILTEQIARQVVAVFESTNNDTVIPTAVAAIKGKGIYLVEFKAVQRSEIDSFKAPIFHRDSMIALHPSVPGI